MSTSGGAATTETPGAEGSASAAPGVTPPVTAVRTAAPTAAVLPTYAHNAPTLSTHHIPKLTGQADYSAWSMIIRRLLKAQRSLGIVMGDHTCPTDEHSDEWLEWTNADNAAALILISTIDPSLHHLVDLGRRPASGRDVF